MKHKYSRARLVLLLPVFFVCSLSMAQSPFETKQNGNAATAVKGPEEEYSKKASAEVVKSLNQIDSVLFDDQAEIKGKEFSDEERAVFLQQMQESQKFSTGNLGYSSRLINEADTSGTKLYTFAKTAKLSSQNVFEVHRDAFVLAEEDRMELKSSSSNYGRNLVTYQQLHHSIPVEGAIYKVREGKEKIEAFGFIAKNIEVNNRYSLTAERALDRALASVNADTYVWESEKLSSLVRSDLSKKPSGELVYVGPNFSSALSEYHLAWKFDILAISPQSSQTIYIDASSGEVILSLNLHMDAQVPGKGKSRYSGSVNFNTEQYSDGFRLEAIQGKHGVPIYTLNMNHATWPVDEVLTDFVDEDNNWDDLFNENHDEAAIDIHWGMQKTVDYYSEKFNRNSVDGQGMTVFGLAHYGENVSNASWTGGWAQFGDGNGTPYVGLGITAHELTHAVTQFTANLTYSGESGALNESFSDIFGVSVEFYVGKDSKEDIWLLGDELYRYGSLRSMSDPNSQSQPDTYGGKYWANPANTNVDNGGVHINSGVSNFWFYLLSEGGDGVNDNEESYSVTAIGLEKAEKVAYITLSEYLSPASSFADMRQATLMVAEDLYGLGSEEYIQITNAWHAVGVGPAYADRQIQLVSYKVPQTTCGPLSGFEPYFITVRNTGTKEIKAYEVLNYKLRVVLRSGFRLIEIYSNDGKTVFPVDVPVGGEAVISVQDDIPYIVHTVATNLVEVNLDFDPIEEFTALKGVGFISELAVLPAVPAFDLSLVSVNLPQTKGEALPSNYSLSFNIANNGCETIPSGDTIAVGYTSPMAEMDTLWTKHLLTSDFIGKSEMVITFDSPLDLSTAGLHTINGMVAYDKDPVKSNNTTSGAIYNGMIAEFPYEENFEGTPGGWTTSSLATTQKWTWQPFSSKFRGIPSEYMWGTINYGVSNLILPNADFTLESPLLDFTNIASPLMEFDMLWLFTTGYDGLIIEYSDDLGQTWHKATNVDYYSTRHFNDLAEGPWFSGVHTITSKPPLVAHLEELAGKVGMVRFRVLMDDSPENFIGAYVDNIVIREAPMDIEVIAADFDAGNCTVDQANGKVNLSFINNFITSKEELEVTAQVIYADSLNLGTLSETLSFDFKGFKDTVHYTLPGVLNFDAAGEYEIIVSVRSTGEVEDYLPENNSYIFHVDIWENEDLKISELPYSMDFEGEDGYKGWRTFENEMANGWQIGDRKALGSPGWFIADHTQFMASNDDVCNCDASEDMLVSPIFDLSKYSEAYLAFDAYADALRLSDGYVKVSTDGGLTWETIMTLPYISAWIEYDLDLSNYAGQSCVQIAFHHDDNGLFASGFAVDNIVVRSTKFDFTVTDLVAPEFVYLDAPSHQFFLLAKNNSYGDVLNSKVEFTILRNGTAIGEAITQEINTSLAQNENVILNLESIPELEVGKYELQATLLVDGEVDITDNMASAFFEVIAKAPLLTEITFSDFEQGPVYGTMGWISNEGSENYPFKVLTQFENPNLSMPKTDHTGDKPATLLYNQLEGVKFYGEVISSFYTLPNSASMEFYYAMQSNVLNALMLDVKVPGGEWESVWEVNNNGVYVDRDWIKAVVNLTEYSGKQVMFRFRHAKAGGYSYMQLDDISVKEGDLADIAIELLSPRDVCGSEDVFSVKVSNKGNIAVGTNAVVLDLQYFNTGEILTETVEAGIPVGGSVIYTFKSPPTLENKGDSHVFNLHATMKNESVVDNNDVANFVYQNVGSDFTIFDTTTVHTYSGQAKFLDANKNVLFHELRAASFTWNTGQTTESIMVTEPGVYTVSVKFENGCERSESIEIIFDDFANEMVAGQLCGPDVILEPGDYSSYLWFDGSTEPIYIAKENGEYYVTVYNEHGLGKTLRTEVAIMDNPSPAIIRKDLEHLSTNLEASTYQWKINGRVIPNANKASIVALWEGIYTLEVLNSTGCISESTPVYGHGLLVGKMVKTFRVFPNPTDGELNIFLADKVEGLTMINIYSSDGQVKYSEEFASIPEKLDLSQLSPGTYILECIVQGEKFTAKVIRK